MNPAARRRRGIALPGKQRSGLLAAMPPVGSASLAGLPPRYNVLGVGVHALDLAQAAALVIRAAENRSGGYVCFCDVNSVSCARRDAEHRRYLNHSYLTTPDGMPVVWMGRRQGHPTTGRVYGPDLLLTVAEQTARSGMTHFFCGAGPGTAPLLAKTLQGRFPGLNVVGTYTPPYRNLDPGERDELQANLDRLRPDFLWVGLSTPKQERFMATLAAEWNVGLSLGVGAAFDFLSGRVRQAPRWVQRSGFEWVWRLLAEPRRLGPRYLRNNPLFVLRAAAQLTRLKRYPTD